MNGNLFTALVILVAALILALSDYGTETRVYDCSVAEWSSEIPKAVKEECRRLRTEPRITT